MPARPASPRSSPNRNHQPIATSRTAIQGLRRSTQSAASTPTAATSTNGESNVSATKTAISTAIPFALLARRAPAGPSSGIRGPRPTRTATSGLGHELVEAGARLLPRGAAQQRRPAEQQPGRAQRLPRPAVEAEVVAVVDDQRVLGEAERGAYVVLHRPPRLREGVGGEP